MARELLTASRMTTLLTCPRKHYYRYELGLVPVKHALALRFGSAFHKAMEQRWKGATFEEALKAALETAEAFEELDAAILAGLLAGYYARYAVEAECVASLQPETSFRYALKGSLTFNVCGMIDGLGVLKTGWLCLLEHKTTGEDISPASDYWLRLRFNPQIYQYVHAARHLGHNVVKIIYDVTRKPAIRPRETLPALDADGLKQVIDASGNRVFKKDGAPKQSADSAKGETLLTASETPEQFADRLAADTLARPEFYFGRREVAVLDEDLNQFAEQRLNLGKLILHFRATARLLKAPEWAWPRACSGMTCQSCEYSGFCLANVSVDVNQPPAGFKAGVFNPELQSATE